MRIALGLGILFHWLTITFPTAHGRPATELRAKFHTAELNKSPARLLTSNLSGNGTEETSLGYQHYCVTTSPSYEMLQSIDEEYRLSQHSRQKPHKRLLPLSKGTSRSRPVIVPSRPDVARHLRVQFRPAASAFGVQKLVLTNAKLDSCM